MVLPSWCTGTLHYICTQSIHPAKIFKLPNLVGRYDKTVLQHCAQREREKWSFLKKDNDRYYLKIKLAYIRLEPKLC